MLTARIAVIASGGGTNLQALIDAQGRGELKSGSIALVIADKAGIGAIQRSEKAGIPCAVIVTCLFYGAISGSCAGYGAAVGSMTIPHFGEAGV